MYKHLVTLILIALSCTARAAEAPTFSDASQRLMAVQLKDGTFVSESMPIHPAGTIWYVPLTEMAEALGFELQVNPEKGIVEGFIFDESRDFELKTETCEFTQAGEKHTFKCEEAINHDDDIYITTNLLSEILPVKVDVDTFREMVTVEGLRKLPVELTKVVARQKKSTAHDPGYPKVEAPAELIDGFMVDQQIGLNSEKLPFARRADVLTHDTIFAGELLGMEANAHIIGRNLKTNQLLFNLAKRDVDGELFGPLGATELQLLHVNLPSVPLIGGAGLFGGALLSSYPLRNPNQYGTQDFTGNLQAGWQVELYQNDVLIDRRLSVNGQYEFKAVPLIYGSNRFRLVFYGPQGQRRETFETYTIDSSFSPPGTQNYRIGYGDAPEGARYVIQYDKSLAKNLSLITAYSRMAPDKITPVQYGLIGARAFRRNVLFSSTAAFKENGGFALENGAQGPLLGAVAGASYTRLNRFSSEVFVADNGIMPRDVVRGNVAFNAFSSPTFRFTFEGSHTVYENEEKRFLLTQRTSTSTGPVLWFNTLNYDQRGRLLTGELSSISNVLSGEVRAGLAYNRDRFTGSTLELRRRLADRLTGILGWQEIFVDRFRKFYTSLNREFDVVTLSANAATDNKGYFQVGALLSYSFGREPRTGVMPMNNKPQAMFGNASVFVFLDTNQNGIRDEGEPPLKGAEITIDTKGTGVTTDDEGNAILTRLTAFEPVDVSISLRSLSDVTQRPNFKGLRFTPRPGKFVQLDIPIITSSEITGFVHLKIGDRERPRRGIPMDLVDEEGRLVRTSSSAADGYFLLDDLRAGTYILKPRAAWLKMLRLKSVPESIPVTISPAGQSDATYDFALEPEL